MELVKVSSGRRIVLPKSFPVKEGDILELSEEGGDIILKPVAVIPKSQQWFWSKRWQKMEKQASDEIERGESKEFDNIDSLLADLKR